MIQNFTTQKLAKTKGAHTLLALGHYMYMYNATGRFDEEFPKQIILCRRRY